MAPLTQPHGFINTTALENQYRRAHIANYVPGMHDPKEYETVELLEDIFNKVVWRNHDDIHINSQQPPGIQSGKACDIVVKYNDEHGEKRILCFVECKRTKNVTPYRLNEVEDQAFSYCKDYLASEPNLDFVYACTACGAHIRLWKFERGTDAFGIFWGSPNKGSWVDYKDVGVDEDAREIQKCLSFMTSMSPELQEGQSYSQIGSMYGR